MCFGSFSFLFFIFMKIKIRYASALTDDDDCVTFDIQTLEDLSNLYDMLEQSTVIKETDFGFSGLLLYKESDDVWGAIVYNDTIEY